MKKGPITKEFSYSGNLAENPLPELLFTIGQYKVPGAITFQFHTLTKQIFVRDGNIIFAASNAAEDHLGEFLFRCSKITRSQLDQSIQMVRKNKGKRLGELLVHMKALPPNELKWAVRSHLQAIIWSLFNWFEGEMKFEIGTFRQDEQIQLDVPIPRAILDGVRSITHAKRVVSYLGNRNTVLEHCENALLAIEAYGADEKERDILKRVDGKTSLYDVCASTTYGAHETAKILYGLLTLRLIRMKEPIRVSSSLPSTSFT